MRNVVPDVFHAHLGLGGFDFDPPAFVLNPDELGAGGAECCLDGVGAFVDLGAGGDEGFEFGFLAGERFLPLRDRNPERGIFRIQRFDPALVICDIHPAGVEEFGKFGDAGGHGTALAVQVFLLLALCGHSDSDFVEGIGCRAFAFAGDLNAHFRFAAGSAAGIEPG